MARPKQPDNGIDRRTLLAMLGGITIGGVLLSDLVAGDVPVPVAETTPLRGPQLPKVLSCGGWNAREPTGQINVVPARPDRIIVHHTASPNVRADGLNLSDLARAIQNDHMDVRNWIDSGHNFLINRAGLVAEGRHRSLEALIGGRHFVQGDHCKNQNMRSIGIENEGTYTEATPPAALFATLRVLCAFTSFQYRIKPSQIYGHRDFADTACPGDKLYAMLPSLRVLVTRLLVPQPSAAARAALPKAALPKTALPKTALPTTGKPGAPKPGAKPSRPGARNPATAPFLGPGSLTESESELLEPGYLEPYVVSPPTWPLLRIADRGPIVLAAQHLLRAAGMSGVPVDGAFGRTTADGVFAFQRAHGLDLTGMIGGASWPLLAVPVRLGHGGEADQAAQVLLRSGPGAQATESVPRTVQRETWQRLLGTG